MNQKQHEAYVALGKAWDSLDAAANRVITALPCQMTEAAESLDEARKQMRHVINSQILAALFEK